MQLFLRKHTEADFEQYQSLVQADAVMKYITGKGLTAREARRKFDEMLAVNEQHLGFFMVYNTDEEFIGDCKLERYREDRSLLEIGYILKEEFWGRGYGTIICTELLSLADQFFPQLDVIGIIDPDNAASKRLLEKFGFQSFFIGIEDDLPTEKLILRRIPS